MKFRLFVLFLMLAAFFAVGCEDNDRILVVDAFPAAPQGLYSVTGDGAVYLYWNAPYEDDIEGFVVWRSFEASTGYTELATITAEPNPNLDLVIYEYVDQSAVNGVTYYYAVSAFDEAGQLSDLSAEDIMDTPRPEGTVDLFDTLSLSTASAFSFSAMSRVSYNSGVADVFVDYFDGIFYINVSNDQIDIQDVGYTETFDDVSWAPVNGWSENGWLELIDGHTYIIWTSDLHFAKMRVTSINANSISFQWAYQTDVDNPELVAPNFVTSKPVHKAGYLNKSVTNEQ